MQYDILIDEALKKGLCVREQTLKYNDGRIKGNRIAIRKDIDTSRKKACVLAEELGHHATSAGDILNQNDANNRRQERAARKWAYEKIVPIENIRFALKDGHTEVWDMAEYLDVDEEFLREALKHYGILDI